MKIKFLVTALTAIAYLLPTFCGAQIPSDGQLEAIEKLMAPQRQKINAVLEADKTGQYKAYLADIEALANEKDKVRKKELIQKMETRHLAFIQKAYADAKINNTLLKAEVAKILGTTKFGFDAFANITIDFTPPSLSPPSGFEINLDCSDFDAADESSNSTILGYCGSFASASNCNLHAGSVSGLAGGCRSKADLGAEVELPIGSFNKITVVGKSTMEYEGIAVSTLGYAQANIKFGVRFRAPGIDKTTYVKEVMVIAPIIWYNEVSGKVTGFNSQASFTGNFAGGTKIKAQLHAEAFAISAASAATWMDADLDPIESIQVIGSN